MLWRVALRLPAASLSGGFSMWVKFIRGPRAGEEFDMKDADAMLAHRGGVVRIVNQQVIDRFHLDDEAVQKPVADVVDAVESVEKGPVLAEVEPAQVADVVPEPEQVSDAPDEPVKRKRGRPRKVVSTPFPSGVTPKLA